MQFISQSVTLSYSQGMNIWRSHRIMIAQLPAFFRTASVALVVPFVVAGCASQDIAGSHAGPTPITQSDREVRPRPARQTVPTGEKVAAVALQQVGAPYLYGGNSPSGFDCSGLVQYAYSRLGLSVARTTSGLWHDSVTVSERDLQSGDLLFFSFAGKMSHVGVYLGDGEFVHAPSSGKSVSVESLRSEYYARALLRAGRPAQH